MTDLALQILTASNGKTNLFSVGQAGYVIKNSMGKLLGIDLYLSECVERVEGNDGFKRLLPKVLSPFDLVFDVIIATHPHYDHFDMDSIPCLMSNSKTVLYASENCEDEVKRLMMTGERCNYIKPGDNAENDGFAISFINCDHGTGAPDAVGVLIETDGKRILFIGDSCLRTDFIGEYTKSGRIDIMIAPINGAYGNLNESECAELAELVAPELTIPCHYGMFASHGGNPGSFLQKMNEKQLKYKLMSLGEHYTI